MAKDTVRVMGKDLPVQEQSAPTSGGMVNLSPETQSNLKEYFKQVMFDGEGKYADQFKKDTVDKYANSNIGRQVKSAKGMKNGGTASSRGDGIATKGKTRGRIV